MFLDNSCHAFSGENDWKGFNNACRKEQYGGLYIVRGTLIKGLILSAQCIDPKETSSVLFFD